jgi:hypothetical protein
MPQSLVLYIAQPRETHGACTVKEKQEPTSVRRVAALD